MSSFLMLSVVRKEGVPPPRYHSFTFALVYQKSLSASGNSNPRSTSKCGDKLLFGHSRHGTKIRAAVAFLS